MNQNPYIAGSRLAVENSRFFLLPPFARRILFFLGFFNGGEGGIARGYAARPPLRSGPSQLRCDVQHRLRRFCRTPFFISRVRIPASWLPRLSDRNRRELTCRVAEREGFEPSMGF